MKNFLTPDKENELLKIYDLVIGIDEVGRGAWAGPLLLGAYVFSKQSNIIEGVNDSKLISKTSRESLTSRLVLNQHFIKILDNKEIDKVGLGNYLNSSLSEFIEEIETQLSSKNVIFLIDGYFKGKWGSNVRFETKADRNYYSVAAASIIAKVTRDNMMAEFGKIYPDYAFEEHVGYGTKKHRQALSKFGPCEIHRKSYKPLKLSTIISDIENK